MVDIKTEAAEATKYMSSRLYYKYLVVVVFSETHPFFQRKKDEFHLNEMPLM